MTSVPMTCHLRRMSLRWSSSLDVCCVRGCAFLGSSSAFSLVGETPKLTPCGPCPCAGPVVGELRVLRAGHESVAGPRPGHRARRGVRVPPDRLVAYLSIGLGAEVVFLTSPHVALGHYYYAWMPLPIALAGIGFGRAGWPARHPGRSQALIRMAAVCLVLALVVASVVRLGAAVEQARVAGIARLKAELRAHGVDPHGTILFGGYNIVAWKLYFPPPSGTWGLGPGAWERDADDVTAVVHGVNGRFPLQPGVASFLRTHHDEVEHFTVDELQV